ncbi:MAG: hypothetical protein K9W44_05180 [Candidatus Lokiarchaeota archaeon]|nr:hypothetical protein [Candidatus Harpocratesius repetitus]
MKTKLIIDTSTWIKFDELIEERIISIKFIDKLTQISDIYVTHEIERELDYFNVISYQKMKKEIFIVPISNKEIYQKTIEDGYDSADSSIIGVSEIKDYLIISEDRPLVEYYSLYKLKIMFFADLIWVLLNNDMISKNKAYKFIHPLQKMRNLPIKKYNCLIKKIEKY